MYLFFYTIFDLLFVDLNQLSYGEAPTLYEFVLMTQGCHNYLPYCTQFNNIFDQELDFEYISLKG